MFSWWLTCFAPFKSINHNLPSSYCLTEVQLSMDLFLTIYTFLLTEVIATWPRPLVSLTAVRWHHELHRPVADGKPASLWRDVYFAGQKVKLLVREHDMTTGTNQPPKKTHTKCIFHTDACSLGIKKNTQAALLILIIVCNILLLLLNKWLFYRNSDQILVRAAPCSTQNSLLHFVGNPTEFPWEQTLFNSKKGHRSLEAVLLNSHANRPLFYLE